MPTFRSLLRFGGEVFGHSTAQFGKQFIGNPFFDDVVEPERSVDTAWNKKGSAAPGATPPEGRLATMDIMGIERQLIFPQVVLALPAWSDHPGAGKVLREYNDTVLRWTKAGKGRLRPTALLSLTTIEGAIAEAERVIDAGARYLHSGRRGARCLLPGCAGSRSSLGVA